MKSFSEITSYPAPSTLATWVDGYGDLAFEVYGPASLGTEGYAVNFMPAFFETAPVSQEYLKEWVSDYGGYWHSIEDLGKEETGETAGSGGVIFPTKEAYEAAMKDLLSPYAGKFKQQDTPVEPLDLQQEEVYTTFKVGDRVRSTISGEEFVVVPVHEGTQVYRITLPKQEGGTVVEGVRCKSVKDGVYFIIPSHRLELITSFPN